MKNRIAPARPEDLSARAWRVGGTERFGRTVSPQGCDPDRLLARYGEDARAIAPALREQ